YIFFILPETQYGIMYSFFDQKPIVHCNLVFIEFFVEESDVHCSGTGIIIQLFVDNRKPTATELRIDKVFYGIVKFFLIEKIVRQIKTRDNHYHYQSDNPQPYLFFKSFSIETNGRIIQVFNHKKCSDADKETVDGI